MRLRAHIRRLWRCLLRRPEIEPDLNVLMDCLGGITLAALITSLVSDPNVSNRINELGAGFAADVKAANDG